MKRKSIHIFVLLLLLCLIQILLFGFQQQATAETLQPFEIHIFDVEQGDSQLIIFPSGYTILIDASELSWNSGKTAALIAGKIRKITG